MVDILERGYLYHAHFIYNKPKLKNKRSTNPDWVTSLEVVKFAVDLMASWGYDRTYYHDRDAMPGATIFDEFFSAVDKSMYIIVIVTRGFIEDLWSKYKSQSALNKLLESDKSRRFIAIYINLENDNDIPPEMKTIVPLTFGRDWKTELSEWDKLKCLLSRPTIPITDTGPDNYTASATSSNLEVNKERSLYSSRFHAVQDTNPPDLAGLHMVQGYDIGTDSPVSMDMETTGNDEENYSESQSKKNTDPKQLVSASGNKFEESLNQTDLEIDNGRSISDNSECSILNRSKSSRQEEILSPRQNRQQYAQIEQEKSTDSGLDSLLRSNDNSVIGSNSIGTNSVSDATIQVGRDNNQNIHSQSKLLFYSDMEATLNGENMSHSQRSQNTEPKRYLRARDQSFDESSLNRTEFKFGSTILDNAEWSFPTKPKSSEKENYLEQSLNRQQCTENEQKKSTEKRTSDTNPIPVVGSDDHKTLSQEETSLFKKKTDLVTIKDNIISLAGYGLKCICDISLYICKADQSFF